MSIIQILLAIDQFFNCFWYIKCDGWGMADEAISARAFRCYLQGYISDIPMKLINTLFFNKQHCYNAWKAEWSRAQQPNHYRGNF